MQTLSEGCFFDHNRNVVERVITENALFTEYPLQPLDILRVKISREVLWIVCERSEVGNGRSFLRGVLALKDSLQFFIVLLVEKKRHGCLMLCDKEDLANYYIAPSWQH